MSQLSSPQRTWLLSLYIIDVFESGKEGKREREETEKEKEKERKREKKRKRKRKRKREREIDIEREQSQQYSSIIGFVPVMNICSYTRVGGFVIYIDNDIINVTGTMI